ncbi:conjugative transposon protein TraM [Pedobacter sp. KLB.chiD]|uniref:conjugative transposon protein TraM n=1 Tax=Pedobacter sp. KLB.chiD TaxID=3387402 RepID=UPI00399AD4F2
MKEQSNIRIRELGKEPSPEENGPEKGKIQNMKKYLIFFLMGIVCLGCMYMIFSPAEKPKGGGDQGLNEVVPMASVDVMQEDKGKAYEKELIEKKQQEERNSLTALSDYWNNQNPSSAQIESSVPEANGQQQAISSYKNVQHTLGNFYEKEPYESSQLREELNTLRSQLAQKETKTADPVASQIALMEKSYQLAAKYLPPNGKAGNSESKPLQDTNDLSTKKNRQPLYRAKQQVVSALYREQSDSAFIQSLNNGFITVGQQVSNDKLANSIKACIASSQKISNDSPVRIRILQAARLKHILIPKGSILVGAAKFQNTRLQLLVTSVEVRGNIIPVELTAYDMEGQPGIQLPYSAERNALTEVVANMGNTGGTSIALSSNTNQQLTSDLSRSLIQGVSGYFSKKVRMPQVTLKAGLELYLVSKK